MTNLKGHPEGGVAPCHVLSTTTYYRDTAVAHANRAPLEGSHDVDTLIVGGGFAGLNTALSMAERGGRDIMLLEAEDIGHGASGRNGGFVFAGYSLAEQALIDRLGAERARQLFLCTVAAVEKVRTRIQEYDMDCSIAEEGVVWANWFRDPGVLRQRQRLLAEQFGVHWDWLTRDEIREWLHTDRYSAGLFEPRALHLHPLNYALGLATAAETRGVRIHEYSRVGKLERGGDTGWSVRTTQGASVRARRVVLACGGYLSGLESKVDRAIMPIATYVAVTEPLGTHLADIMTTRAAVYDTRFAFDYYRALPDTRLLWGGRISIRRRKSHAVGRLLRRDMRRVYPQLDDARVDYAWSGLMSYARHEMPQIGQDGQDLWWAQAFGGHGLAPTTVAGELLGAALAEGDDGWKAFSDFGLVDSWRPLGYLGAQARYSWLQLKDRFKSTLEG